MLDRLTYDVILFNIELGTAPMPVLSRRHAGDALALLTAAALCAALTGALFARSNPAPGSRAPGDPMPVAVTRFEQVDAHRQERRFLGVVQAASRSAIGFEVAGTIADISVRAGEQVDAGSVLARLDTRALEARRRAAEADALQLAAELELARARTRRQAPLQETGAISAQGFDDTRLREKALGARHRAARARLAALEIELEKSVLRAPYPALVGERLLDQGAVARPGEPVLSLVASRPREAHVGIAVEQARKLQPGGGYTLSLGDREIPATLHAIRPDVDPLTMTTSAIFDLPEGIDAFDGEPVAISLPRRVPGPGGWLPLSALLEGERGVWTVLVIDPADSVLRTRREVVEVVHVRGDRAFVRGTLRNGDRVIADGVHRVAPGTPVRVAGD